MASKTAQTISLVSAFLSGDLIASGWYWWLERAMPRARRSSESPHFGRRDSTGSVSSLFVS